MHASEIEKRENIQKEKCKIVIISILNSHRKEDKLNTKNKNYANKKEIQIIQNIIQQTHRNRKRFKQ